MQYSNTVSAEFIDRPNRFIAHVRLLDGTIEIVHVKNTGRCRELLLPGASVILSRSTNPARKTRYDLISVYKPRLGWVNIDSQAPNEVMFEWLQANGYTGIRPEYSYRDSRLDFFMEKENARWLCEVKGCTLEIAGNGFFPDAPTVRGTKHLTELKAALADGYHSAIAFVIPMNGIRRVFPNTTTDPRFAAALKDAWSSGVEIWYLCCDVTPETLTITECIKAEETACNPV